MTDAEKLKIVERVIRQRFEAACARNTPGCAIEMNDLIKHCQEELNDDNFAVPTLCWGVGENNG